MPKAPTFTSWGFVNYLKIVSSGIRFIHETKIHFRPYIPNQRVLFLQRIDGNIADKDLVRMVDALVEGLNLDRRSQEVMQRMWP